MNHSHKAVIFINNLNRLINKYKKSLIMKFAKTLFINVLTISIKFHRLIT